MTNSSSAAFYNETLNRLENLELPLLSWGITDGSLTEDEVRDALEAALLKDSEGAWPSGSVEDLLFAFRDLGWLFRVPGTSPPRYRTRLAETVRLASQLRQLFPSASARAEDPQWWEAGKRLVADYRLYAAPRSYPPRDIGAEAALKELAMLPDWGQTEEQVAAAQIGQHKLARFQVDASVAVYRALRWPRSRGVIVGAGTGSGKTLSFYLPAFSAMAEGAHLGKHRLHTLALYPRKELLRDQLREAVRTAQALEPTLKRLGRRPLRIGALYGDTPKTHSDQRLEDRANVSSGWQRRRDGAICPFLSCPNCEHGELLWRDSDRDDDREVLVCLNSNCRCVIPDGRLALTRKSQEQTPPDLLFTTTEMLNRNSANYGLGKLLGWQGAAGPSLVLLDEVHTYAGVHGAQVAMLLRRWRNAQRRPVAFVGLSATLRDAEQFFARLVGLDDGDVEYIQPNATAMIHEGREYALALRGDPVAGGSLLSTSIQTAMLFGRMLDPQESALLFGSTGFLFTDDLDVTNRFYDDLRDAEGGQNRFGQTRGRPVLAALRASKRKHQQARYRDGQSWDLVEKIGHVLGPDLGRSPLRIGRTSSQDVGVDLQADLTVATASLEVGFNDPRVGLVLQHKAPHDAAAFIQRRGRAGRRREMRPLTVVTLSDYGRDRLAYQGYEALFQPEVPRRNLPVRNRFIIKIQGAQSLLDWVARKLRSRHRWVDPRELLTAPWGGGTVDAAERSAVAALLEDLLINPVLQDGLARHLGAALQIRADEVQALLWEEPRSLMLSVVPTALRRLKNKWQTLRDDPGAASGLMLPEFVTRSLFEPLNVPEVSLALPFASATSGRHGYAGRASDSGPQQEAADERLPIGRALREAVPGKVSRRYGHQRDEHRTWLPIPDLGDTTLELDENLVLSAAAEGRWHPLGHDRVGLEVLRPYRLKLAEPPKDVADRSQGFPLWGSQIVVGPHGQPTPADVPDPSPWRRRIVDVAFATHAAGNPVELRRMTMGARFEVSDNRGNTHTGTVRYTLRGEDAALGFRLAVDAARFSVHPLDVANPAVAEYLASHQWRTLAFFQSVADDPSLAEVTNHFQRGWLSLVYLTAFSLRGLDSVQAEPADIHSELGGGAWGNDLVEILRVLYRDASTAQHPQAGERLVVALSELSRRAEVRDSLDRAGRLLVDADIRDRTADLARRSYRETLAAAILAAALRACPDAQDGDLIVDIVPGAGAGDPAAIWLSETSIGGLGLMEQFARYYTEDPRRFWRLVETSLAPNDYEYVDATLSRLLQDMVSYPQGAAARAMAALRFQTSAAEAEQALTELREAWARLDGPPRHSAVATLSTRLLRPGSGPGADAATLALVEAWAALESRLGIEVDARVVAYAAGSGRLSTGPGRKQSADQAFSMLWPRGQDARNRHLHHYQPYLDRPPVLDRLLVTSAHDDQLPCIDVTTEGWEQKYRAEMARRAAVELVAPTGDAMALSNAIVRIPALPVDRDVLRVYGEVRGLVRMGNQWCARVDLREAVQ